MSKRSAVASDLDVKVELDQEYKHLLNYDSS